MSSETETRLRAALQASAALITYEVGAEDDTPIRPRSAGEQSKAVGDGSRTDRQRRRASSWAVVAAAAVVILVAAFAFVLRSHHVAQPTAPSPTSPTPTVTRKPAAFVAASCTIPLPAAWSAAEAADKVAVPGSFPGGNPGSLGLAILAVGSDGDVVTETNIAPSGQLVLVKPNRVAQVIYRAPAPTTQQGTIRIGSAQITDNWILFSLIVGGGQGSLSGIDVINRQTNAVQVVRAASVDLIQVSVPILRDNTVYWSETDNTSTGAVYGYNLATNTKKTLATGQIIGPQLVGGGLYWSKAGNLITYVPGSLPVGYAVLSTKINTLFTDGTTFAWGQWVGTGTDQRYVIKMASSTNPNPTTVYTPPNSTDLVSLLGLTGPILILSDNTNILALDTRTGALTPLENISQNNGFATSQAAGGTIAINWLGSKGGPQLSVLRQSALPELKC